MITISKIQEYINSGRDHYEIAKWLVNTELHKHIPMGLDDLSDSSTVANELEAIVECLQGGEYQDALNISIESAEIILEEEGFELNN